MSDMVSRLGIQSYCFRGFESNEDVIRCLKECGVSTVELCCVHMDFSDVSAFDGVIGLYADAGIDIVAIGVETMLSNETEERKRFEFMKKAGAEVMSIDFHPSSSPESWRTAERLAEEYDVRLGIHNHGGHHWLGSSQMLEHVFANTNDRIGLCLDTAWALDSREDPVAMAERFGTRLYGVHVKDFVFDRARQPEDVVVGQGNLDLPAFLGTLEKVGFNGAMVLEYEGDVENPVPALTSCVNAVREAAQ